MTPEYGYKEFDATPLVDGTAQSILGPDHE